MLSDPFRLLAFPLVLLLVGCGGGPVKPSGPFSVEDGTFGSNGIAHATPDVGVADLVGESMAVTVVRFLTDYDTGLTRLIASDETISVHEADGFGVSEEFNLSFAGEDLFFTNASATDSRGREWTALPVTFGDASATTGLYSYSYGAGAGAIDSEGVFVAGFETSPADISGRSDMAAYSGDWFGYGVLLDRSGELLATELEGGGSAMLTVDFGASIASGQLAGSYAMFGDLEVSFGGAEIVNGGFVGEAQSSCSSACASNTTMAGRFYGSGAGEVSGIIAWDETRDSGAMRLQSAAGFTLSE